MRGHRWYWDRVTQRGFGQLSQRCVFADDELADKLHVTPAVTFTTAPAGGGMRLFGDFKRGPYSFRLEAGARTVDGGTLHGRLRDDLLGAGALAAGDLRRQGALPAAQRLASRCRCATSTSTR